MPPSSLSVALDMVRVEPHLRTATVYLDLYLFGSDIHVDFEHFPRCYRLKSLVEKFRILHAAAFLPQLCKKSHFNFALGCWPRGTSAQLPNAKDGHFLQRVAKPDQERTE